jgi:hypothetical protein
LFNLERLCGVTVAWDYATALTEINRGIETDKVLAPTADGIVSGVAMTPIVVQEGEPKSHMVLDAAFVSVIVDEKHELFKQAIYIVAHEAAHAHELAHQYKVYPDSILKPVGNYRDALLLKVALTCWDEFAACCLSSGFAAPEQLGYYEDTFCTKLDNSHERGNGYIRAYRAHRDVGKLLDQMVSEFGDLLKYAAYLTGHIYGRQLDFGSVAPKAAALIEQRQWFKVVFEAFYARLQQMWDEYQNWDGIGVYDPLKQIVHDLLEVAGIELIEQPVGVYVDVPYSEETLPEYDPLSIQTTTGETHDTAE